MHLGRREWGVETCRRALELAPDHAEARKLRRDLLAGGDPPGPGAATDG